MSNTITLSRDRMQIGDGLRARALFETTQLPEIDDRALSGNARSTRKSSIFLPRIIVKGAEIRILTLRQHHQSWRVCA